MCTKLLKQIKEMAEPLHVQVTSSSVCDSLTLVGTKEAVASVDRQLATKSKEVEDSLIETVVDVDSARVTAIPEESLKAQLSCLEQERTVRITVKKSTVKETQASRSNICKFQVVKGNLSDEVADAIVCPITADFLPQPGLTNDAIRAGGKALQEEIRRYQNVCGTLKATVAFDLPAGDLKACMAILVVMPKPILPGCLSSLLGDFDSDFLASIKNILSVAERLQVRSLSLPVLGKRDCMSRKKLARLMTSAVKEYVLKTDNSVLNCVRILTLDEEEIEEFRKAMPVHEVETGQAQSMTPTYRIIKRGQWMYEEDTGRYKPFDSASNAILEEKYVHSAAQAVVSIGSFTYKIDFSKMTQINKKTGKCRKLQRIDMSPANKSYQWAYRGDAGKFYNYDDGSNSILEDAWKDGRMVTFLTVNSHAYRVELDKWTQINVSTRTRRSIQRLAIANLADSGRSPLTTAKNASESESYGHQFTVKGQGEDVAVAASKLEAILQVERSSKCFSVPNSVYEEFRQEIDIQTRRFQVKVKRRSREGTSVKIELEGISSLVDCAIQAIQQSIIARQTKSGIMSTSRPSEWDPQDDNTKLKMVTVSPASREFGVVKSKMAKTMPSVSVSDIS
jgi:O-acetyl-ADP-ribose deacetylase (regulator of RNase III)